MEELLQYNLEIKVFKYKNKTEKDKHIKKMEGSGWGVRQEGETILLADSTITEYMDDDNWDYVVEFYREKNKEGNVCGMEYETDIYWGSFYSPRD